MFNDYNRFPMGMLTVFLLALTPLFFACSDSYTAGTDEQSEGIVAIKDRKIAGVSQKGPFLVGSSVSIQELDGHTLVQTGRSFKSSVKSDRGNFVVSGVNLSSQYAFLEVNGYYRNEYTGKTSEGMIFLNAITDLKNRDHVNVNLLTHLEADRVLNLVQKQGLSFASAKKQAEMEIFSSFGFIGSQWTPEDMDIFSSDNGAALLAVSVLMQSDISAAELLERLSVVSRSFAESGIWDDSLKASLADWAMLSETPYSSDSTLLMKIRRNMESWSDSVPQFEKYVNLFWSNAYGLGECTEGNVYEVRPNGNPKSMFYQDEFVCNPSLRWSLVSYREIADDINIAGVVWASKNVRCVTTIGENIEDDASGASPFSYCLVYGDVFDAEESTHACPRGYRLPTREEMQSLIDSFGSPEKAAVGLRAANGFGALMEGFRYHLVIGNPYVETHKTGRFWTSTVKKLNQGDGWTEWFYYMLIDSTKAVIDSADSWSGGGPDMKISARCVRKL